MAELSGMVKPEDAAEPRIGSSIERTSVLWLTNFSHAVNHFQNQMVAVLYVVIMPELGFGYADLGILTAVMSIMGGATQGLYRLLRPLSPGPGYWVGQFFWRIPGHSGRGLGGS
jgi:hypothetical protein